MRRLMIAHSPDADDIFMYYAIAFGWVGGREMAFENVALDIQTLNDEALAGTFDATAISFALYPHIRNDYALLKTAVSFGEGYGPKLIKKRGKKLKKHFKVALSGRHTTNAMLFKIAYPDAKITYINFLEIEKAVLEGVVDAGVLIHESILDFSPELEVEREIWDIWQELSGKELPLPLGGMVLRRSLPITAAIECEEILTQAVRVAHSNKNLLSKMLLERNLVRIDKKRLEQYLSLYANAHSITMDETQFKAVDTLFEIGFRHGFYDSPIKAMDHVIPHDYKRLRFS